MACCDKLELELSVGPRGMPRRGPALWVCCPHVASREPRRPRPRPPAPHCSLTRASRRPADIQGRCFGDRGGSERRRNVALTFLMKFVQQHVQVALCPKEGNRNRVVKLSGHQRTPTRPPEPRWAWGKRQRRRDPPCPGVQTWHGNHTVTRRCWDRRSNGRGKGLSPSCRRFLGLRTRPGGESPGKGQRGARIAQHPQNRPREHTAPKRSLKPCRGGGRSGWGGGCRKERAQGPPVPPEDRHHKAQEKSQPVQEGGRPGHKR